MFTRFISVNSSSMVRSSCLVLFFFICNYIEPGTPALTKDGIQRTQALMKNLCKRSSGVSQDALDQMKNGVFLDDKRLKCYIHCCLGMMKTMKKDKITVPEATKQIEMLLPEEMKEASLKQLNMCKNADGADACDKALNFAKCGYEIDPNNMLIPT